MVGHVKTQIYVNSSNLTLWQDSNHQNIFFIKINEISWQKIISNSIISTFLLISNINDTVILYDSINFRYYASNSEYMYIDTLLTNQIEGSWILMYYSSALLLSLGINSNYNIWTTWFQRTSLM